MTEAQLWIHFWYVELRRKCTHIGFVNYMTAMDELNCLYTESAPSYERHSDA